MEKVEKYKWNGPCLLEVELIHGHRPEGWAGECQEGRRFLNGVPKSPSSPTPDGFVAVPCSS